MHLPPCTDFLELRGRDADARLRAAAAAAPATIGTELLASRDEPGLHLLVCRGPCDDLARLVTPDGATRWRFGSTTPSPTPDEAA